MSAANRRRGHDAERAVAKWLRENGYPDARTTRSMLGHDGAKAPGDVWAIPGVVIEVKDVAGSAWPTWREQAIEEAGDLVPVVVRRTRGVVDVGRWTACTLLAPFWSPRQVLPNDVMVVGCPRTSAMWAETSFAEIVEALR